MQDATTPLATPRHGPAAGPIRALPALLINQIAAGEVVDRPASVVKELVENAIDAGAIRITLDLEQGGIELIRISDDGRGIAPEQLPLALAPHATSKISRAEDLDRIGTLGFRGEALASIASISRLSIRSRTADMPAASIIEAEGDQITDVRPAAGSVGTVIAVRNLFFNTPARRKFLRTPATEQARCLDILRDLAMAHPAIAFAATCDGRAVVDLLAGQSARDRALAILGMELAPQLLEVHVDQFDDNRGLALWGLTGLPAIARGTNNAQHIFLNGRVIRDRTIQHAIKEAYRGLIEPGRHPTCVLMIEMDPSAVDVNVHPAKTEVRFRDSSLVHSLVLRSIREALRAADLTPAWKSSASRVEMGDGRSPLARYAEPGAAATGRTGPASHDHSRTKEKASPFGGFVDYFGRETSERPQHGLTYSELRQALHEPDGTAPPSFTPPPSHQPSQSESLPTPRPHPRILQVHNSYLVTQDEQGVVIVDQHALHERVMFEQLMLRISEAPLESQRLLTPAVVEASPAQVERLAELAPLLSRIGIEAAPIGPTSIGIHAFSTFLFDRHVDPARFLTEILDRSESDDLAPGSEEALHVVLDMMACKAAVKAGDRMSETELAELIHMRDAYERSSNCPHGRPTTIRLTIRELEKLFRRT